MCVFVRVCVRVRACVCMCVCVFACLFVCLLLLLSYIRFLMPLSSGMTVYKQAKRSDKQDSNHTSPPDDKDDSNDNYDGNDSSHATRYSRHRCLSSLFPPPCMRLSSDYLLQRVNGLQVVPTNSNQNETFKLLTSF